MQDSENSRKCVEKYVGRALFIAVNKMSFFHVKILLCKTTSVKVKVIFSQIFVITCDRLVHMCTCRYVVLYIGVCVCHLSIRTEKPRKNSESQNEYCPTANHKGNNF